MNQPLQIAQQCFLYLSSHFSALIQLYTVNPDMLVYTAYSLALLIFLLNLFITKHQFKRFHYKFSRKTTRNQKDTWNTWATPLTGIGGLLGILLAAHTNTLFADLSLLFGGLILLASLFNTMIPEGPLSTYVVTPITSIVILGAVLGELLASLVLLAKTSLSSPLITWGFRSIVLLALLLTFLYVFDPEIKNILQRLHLINAQPAQNIMNTSTNE